MTMRSKVNDNDDDEKQGECVLNDIGTGNGKFGECECPSVWDWGSFEHNI